VKKLWIVCLPLLVVAAGAASAQRSLTPGQFYTGLTESGAEALASQAREMHPGAVIMPSFDVGFRTWSLDLRDLRDSAADAGGEAK